MLLDRVKLTRNVWLWRCEGWGSRGYTDHEILEFCIPQADSRPMNKIATLDFMRTNFGLFTDLLGRIPWEFTIEGKRGPREQVNIQGSFPPGSRTAQSLWASEQKVQET